MTTEKKVLSVTTRVQGQFFVTKGQIQQLLDLHGFSTTFLALTTPCAAENFQKNSSSIVKQELGSRMGAV